MTPTEPSLEPEIIESHVDSSIKSASTGDNHHLLRKIFANKRRMRSLFSFKPTKLSSFIANLVKQQQYYLLSSSNGNELDKNTLDTSIISESFINTNHDLSGDECIGKNHEQTEEKLPGIISILNKTNPAKRSFDLLKKIRKIKKENNQVGTQNLDEPTFDGKSLKAYINSVYFFSLIFKKFKYF